MQAHRLLEAAEAQTTAKSTTMLGANPGLL